MDRLHARYPFLEGAREAVAELGLDVVELVEADDPAVDRAIGRIEACLREGTTGESHRNTRTELLSYPVARVLVSLVGQPVLVRRYADAEARTAHERFTAELSAAREFRSSRGRELTLPRLLAAFDLSNRVALREPPERSRVDVGAYLSLSAGLDGERWRLVNRTLSAGRVPVTREELFVLLREAVRERVAAELPVDPPGEVADALAPAVEHVEALLADHELPEGVDAVVPALFPPCVRTLLEEVEAGEALAHHSRYTLVSFLAAVGLDADEVAAVFEGTEADAVRDQVALLEGEGGLGAYPPPSCETVEAYGDCYPDERCETIANPLSYYAAALEAEEGTEWTGERPLIDLL